MMRVLPPIAIGEAQLVSTTVAAEDPSPVWNGASPWAKDELCHRVQTHMVYRRITAGTSATPPESDPDLWQKLRPTNKWAMFNLPYETRTRVEGGPLTVVIEPGLRVDSLALVGLTGTDAIVTLLGTGIERTYPLLTRNVRSWYQYFTGRFIQRNALTLWDLPPYRGASIQVTITPVSGVAECGRLIVGMSTQIGEMLWDYDNDTTNYSRIERAFDGSLLDLEPRRNVDMVSLRARVDAANVDNVLQVRDDLGATPALWSGWTRHPNSPYAQSALLFGLARRFAVKPENKLYAMANLEIEEM